MTETTERAHAECVRVRAAIASGREDVDWNEIEQHLISCDACAEGQTRLTAAIQEQFAASRILSAEDGGEPAGTEPAVAASPAAATGGAPRRPIAFPAASARRRGFARGVLVGLGAIAAALLLLLGVVALQSRGSGGTVTADRRPEFVPSLDVLPSRPDHTYFAGEQIQVCLRINQPSRVHLSVLEGKNTFDLYDADTSPGEHCFPEQVGRVQNRATLRVDVFYGAERVAREDFVLLPR